MGGGAGTSNRNRALESLEERKQNLSEEIIRDNTLCESVSSKRAKANWQKALEGVTTGRLFANQNGKAYASIKPCIRRLWHWRSCVLACDVAKNKLPSMLIRGWRPSESFLEWLFSRQSNFYWAHPFSLLFRDIPGSVSRSEIHDAIISCLRHLHGKPYNTNIDLVELVSGDRTKAWKSVVFLENKIDYDYVLKKAKGIEGIELRSSEGIQWLDNQIVEAKANYEEAVAANRVFPCAQNSQNEMKAKKELKRANLGLRIFAKERSSPGHVFCVKTIGSIRQAAPSSTYALYTNTNAIIDEARAMIASLQPEIERKERELRNMAKRIQDGVTGNDVVSPSRLF